MNEIRKVLREVCPHGDPRFIDLTLDELDLHSRKNADFARGGPPLGNFERRAQILKLYPGLDLGDPTVVALLDLFKQLDAALWMLAGDYEGDVEDVDTRLRDVGVYAKITRLLHMDQKRK